MGLQRHGEAVSYLHRGESFPCLDECPEVLRLRRLSVAEFLAGQGTGPGEAAQDATVLGESHEWVSGHLFRLTGTV